MEFMKLPQRSQLEQKTDYDYEQDYEYEVKSLRPLTFRLSPATAGSHVERRRRQIIGRDPRVVLVD